MVSVVSEDAGKYLKLDKDSRMGTHDGEYIMVLEHSVEKGRSSNDRTDVGIFSDDASLAAAAAAVAAADGSKSFADEVKGHARILLPQVANTGLSTIIGTGVWRELFKDPTGAGGGHCVMAAGDTGSTLVGKTFTGSLPMVSGGAVVSQAGTWRVTKEATGGTFEVACTVGTVTHTTRVDKVTLEAAIATVPVGTVATDVDVDVADYAQVLQLFSAVGVISSGKISARKMLGVISSAGVKLAAAVQQSDAAQSVLRRQTLAGIESIEEWAEFAVSKSDPIHYGLDSMGKVEREVSRLRTAFMLAHPGCAPPGGVVTPAVTTTVPPSTTATPPAAVVGIGDAALHATPVRHARYTALQSKAVDAAAFDQLCADLMVFVEPDAAKRTVILSHENTRAGQIDAWLKKQKDAADVAVLNGLPAGQDAGELLNFCLAIQAANASATATDGVGNVNGRMPADAAQRGFRYTMRNGAGSGTETRSEQERREVTRIQADAIALEDDAASLARLRAMAVLAEMDDETSHDKLVDAVKAESKKQGALHRLLTSAVDVGSVNVDADPSTVSDIISTRCFLDASLERAMFGKKASRQPDCVLQAMRQVRLERISRCRLAGLVGIADSGPLDAPFAAFEKLGAAGRSKLTSSMQVLQSAWTFAAPSHTGAVTQYMTALSAKTAEALDAGVSMSDTGTYYYASQRRVDENISGFNGKSGVAAPPKKEWANDAAYDWVSTLNEQIAAARSTASALTAQKEQLDAFKTQMEKQIKESGRQKLVAQLPPKVPGQKRPRPGEVAQVPPGVRPGQTPPDPNSKRSQAKAKKLAGANGNGGASTALALTAVAGVREPQSKEERAAAMAAEQTALTAEMGMKEGKQPCWYHHKSGRGCNFSAEKCRCYH